jgi:hypothetical protein
MKSKKVIDPKNLPITKPPFLLFAVTFLYFDRYHVAEWIWGAVICLYFFITIIWLAGQIMQEKVDIFKSFDQKLNIPEKKSFADRLKQKVTDKDNCA